MIFIFYFVHVYLICFFYNEDLYFYNENKKEILTFYLIFRWQDFQSKKKFIKKKTDKYNLWKSDTTKWMNNNKICHMYY